MAAARTPEEELFMAAKEGNLERLEQLIAADADIDEPGEGNETPFSIAFKHRHFDVARVLAEEGADINTEFGWDHMPLLIELTRPGQAPMFPEGAENMLGRGQGFAMLPGTVEDVRRFLELNDVRRPLEHELVDMFITDNRGDTPLINAIRAQNLEMVNVLIDAGADVDIGNDAGEFPLGIAVFLENRNIFTRLLEAGAEIGRNDGDIFIRAASYDDLFFAQQLIARGANVNNLFDEDEPIINVGARLLEIPGLRFLLENGANIEQRNEENKTPLMVAIEERDPAIVEFLIRQGANLYALAENGELILNNARNNVYRPEINATILRFSPPQLRRRHALAAKKGGRRTRKHRSSQRKSRKIVRRF